MSLKSTIGASTITLCLCGALSSPAFSATKRHIPTPGQTKLDKRINYLQHEIDTLQKAKKNKKTHAAKSSSCSKGHCGYNPGHISLGPYLNKDAAFNGSELIINTPSVRENSRLLLAQYKLEQECQQMGIAPFQYPHMTFSGKLEGLASYANPYAGSNVNNIDFSGAELDTYIQGTPWVSGFMALDYDNIQKQNGSRVFLNRAFVTIGNLSKSPVYASIGQVYLPFGRYSSLLVTSPSTQLLGRTRARTIELGYQKTGDNALHAELYAFQGLTTNIRKSNNNNEWGADAGYNYKIGKVSGEFGGSFISNIADSQGFQATAFLPPERLDHRVPAYDVYGSIGIGPFALISEFVQSTRSFSLSDAAFANHGARPSAYHVEGDYTFTSFGKPSTFGIAYGGSSQALALGLPQNRYSAVYNIVIWKDTQLAIEYRHDNNYSRSSVTTDPANPTSATVAGDLGQSDNVISAQFDMYF